MPLTILSAAAAALSLFAGAAASPNPDGPTSEASSSRAAIVKSAPVAVRRDAYIYVINDTAQTMTNFYASNSDSDDWGEDLLGQNVLRAGGGWEVDIEDGSGSCSYDIKAVFDPGGAITYHDVDVCGEDDEVVFTNYDF